MVIRNSMAIEVQARSAEFDLVFGVFRKGVEHMLGHLSTRVLYLMLHDEYQRRQQQRRRDIERWHGRESTGLYDQDGREIFDDDWVVFYFDAVYGYSLQPHDDYTEMVDLVMKLDGAHYFLSDVGGAFAFHHSDFCRVIGRANEQELAEYRWAYE